MHGAIEYARDHMKKDNVMVILLPDHGTRYLAKVYNDQWMKDHGFVEARSFGSARDILNQRNGKDSLITVNKSAKISEAILVFNREGIDQIPVIDNGQFIGSISASSLLVKIIQDPQLQKKQVGDVMDKPMLFVAPDSTLDVLSSLLNKDNKAVLVRDEEKVHIITQHDVLKAMTRLDAISDSYPEHLS